MTRRRNTGTKAQAFVLALTMGLSVTGIVALAGIAVSAPGSLQANCPPGSTPSPTPATATATPCPTPTGTATATGTATPTQTQTTTPTQTTTATQTGTTSPGPTGTQTGSPQPSPTITRTVTTSPVPPGGIPRTVTLEASKQRKTFGRTVTLSGGISSPDPGCATAEGVQIFRTVVGTDTQELFASVTSNEDGTFVHTFSADRSANYTAHVPFDGICGEANSEAEPVLVRVKVNLAVSKQRVRPGARVRLRSTVAPCEAHARTRVILFRLLRGGFAKVDSARLSDDCTATWRKRVRTSTAFQARWPKQDADHLRGKSRKKGVRVVRRR